MNAITIRNVVILALVQIGVVVFTVLFAGATLKWRANFHGFRGAPLHEVTTYGWFALLLPLGWSSVTVWLLYSQRASDQARLFAILMGVGLLGLLLVGAWQFVLRYWAPFFSHM